MSALSLSVPYPVFSGQDGLPLDNGYVWIGTANLYPITNPIAVYFDEALTIQATQPLRTINGFISNAGTPAQVYVDAVNFSILVQDSKGTMVYNFPDGTGLSPDACGVTYNPPFTGGVSYPVCEKLAQTVSVKDFGAVGDGVADDTVAIQAAITSLLATGGTVYFPAGEYKTDDGITLVSDLTLQGETGTILKPSDSVPLWAYRGLSANNIKIKDLTFEGTGTAFTNGNQRLLQIESATNVEITGCEFIKSRIIALYLQSCINVHVNNSNFTRSYYYGGEARDCANVTLDSCIFDLNGDTGTSSTAFGRGFVFWRSLNSTLSNCVFDRNTEYGLRLYSESGDATANRNIAITGCSFCDNGTTATGKIDLYVYDDAKLIERVAISGCTFSTRIGNTSAVLSGREITLSGCTFKAITPQTGNGVSFFGSTNVVVAGNVFHGFDNVASFSSTVGDVSTNCTFSDNQCIDVLRFATLQGAGHIIANNYIKKGGAGAADEGIRAISSNISATISNNVVDGFFRGFNVATTGGIVSFKDNITINSTGTGFFAEFQTDVSGLICTNNSFDSAFPTPWATMFADSRQSFGRKFYISIAEPPASGLGGGANIVWKVGDRVFNANPAIGFPKSWVCTVAGAPGTWTSEGNL